MTRAAIAVLVAACAAVGLGCGGEENPPSKIGRLPAVEPLERSSCSPVRFGGEGRPDLLVAVSTMLQGDFAVTHGLPAVNAIKLVMAQRRWRAGPYTVGLQVCDEVDARTGLPNERTCSGNARAFARNPSVAAVIGPYFSTCALAMVHIANRAPDGPLAMASGGTTYLGLTRSGPGTARDEPERHYPTGRRNYVRVVPADDAQAAVASLHAQRSGVRRPYALHNGDAYGSGLAAAFRESAEAVGLPVSGMTAWNPKATGYGGLAERVRRAGADAVFLAGYHTDNGGRLIADLRRELGPDLLLMASDGFADAEPLVEAAGSHAEGVAITTGVLPRRALPPAGRRFVDVFERRFGQRPCCYAPQFAQAASLVLDAIGRSDGTRPSITRSLFGARVEDGILGDFSIDRYGDTSSQAIGVYMIHDGRLELVSRLTAPPDLLARE